MRHDPPWDDVDSDVEAAIRRDERRRVAELLTLNADTLSSFAGGTGSTVKLIAFMLTMDQQAI